jgi:hypothetical protein
MDYEMIKKINSEVYDHAKKNMAANAQALDIDSDTVENLKRMCDESIIVASSMWKNLFNHAHDCDEFRDGIASDSVDNAENAIKNSFDFMNALRIIADKMAQLGLKRNERYLNAAADQYASAYKKNHKSGSYLIMWIVSVACSVLNNAVDMRDDAIPMIDRTIASLNGGDAPLDHMKQWMILEGLEED